MYGEKHSITVHVHPLVNTQSICVVTATHDRSLALSLKLSALIVLALESSSSVLEREPKPWLQHRHRGNTSRQSMVWKTNA